MYRCNCKNIFYIKDPVGTCAGALIDLGFNSPGAADYVLKLSFLNGEVSIAATFSLNQAMKFPTLNLNENYEYIGQVYAANGTQLKPIIDGVQYDCFCFQTTIKISL